MIEYRTAESVPRQMTLDADGERARLTIPAQFRWFERIGLLIWCAGMTLAAFWWAWFAITMRAFLKSGGVPAAKAIYLMLPIAVNVSMVWGELAFIVLILVDHLLYSDTPRRLEMSGTHLTYSCRGWWGIRFRRYDLDQIKSIRLKPVKGLTGNVTHQLLLIKLGRWKRISVAFGRKTMDLAAPAEAAFRRLKFGEMNHADETRARSLTGP